MALRSGGQESDYAEAYQRDPTTAQVGKMLSPEQMEQAEQLQAASQGNVPADNHDQLYAQVDEKRTREKDDARHTPEADSSVECLYAQVDKTKKIKRKAGKVGGGGGGGEES